jgi:hypothetical protein
VARCLHGIWRLFDRIGSQPIELEPTQVIESPYAIHVYLTVRR